MTNDQIELIASAFAHSAFTSVTAELNSLLKNCTELKAKSDQTNDLEALDEYMSQLESRIQDTQAALSYIAARIPGERQNLKDAQNLMTKNN